MTHESFHEIKSQDTHIPRINSVDKSRAPEQTSPISLNTIPQHLTIADTLKYLVHVVM